MGRGLGRPGKNRGLKSPPIAKYARSYNRRPQERKFFIVEAGASMESGFQCAGCGEWNTTAVDESAGRRQSYVEDCQVCCKPNVLMVEYDASSREFFIMAELE